MGLDGKTLTQMTRYVSAAAETLGGEVQGQHAWAFTMLVPDSDHTERRE